MIITDKLEQQLRDAVDYIESLHDAIETTMNDRGIEMIYHYQGIEVNFDVKEAKALLAQLEEKANES
tara:strand:+ start:6927 stop:7127 length:201 start_codon:yes stop_codon:yes gene_type:complete